MRLLLQRPTPGGPPVEKVMAFVCGPYARAEVQFGDGRMFSSAAPDGVRFLTASDAVKELERHANYWDAMDLPWQETPEIIRWCESEVGSGYDYRGAIASGFGLAVNNAEKWFDSEISAEVVRRASGEKIPGLLCPTALGFWVKGLLVGKLTQKIAMGMLDIRNKYGRINLPPSMADYVDSLFIT